MPRLSIWSLRFAFLYLAGGFSLGALLLFHKGIPVIPIAWLGLPAHIEFLLIGWIVQLILGVAFWILPRFRNEPKRGRVGLAWAALILLNLGIWLVSIGSLLPSPGREIMPLAGRLSELLAGVSFAWHAWPRVRATRS